MKGGRIALPSEYFSTSNTNNYIEQNEYDGSRLQMGCENFVGPNLQVKGRQAGGSSQRRRRTQRRNSNRRIKHVSVAFTDRRIKDRRNSNRRKN